jgi:ribosomal protein L11 methyltransferase
MRRSAAALEQVWVEVPERAVEAYEAALSSVCDAVGFFFADEPRGIWRVEGVREAGAGEGALAAALALAAAASGVEAEVRRQPVEAEGWLARTQEAFPEQRIGRRLAVRGTHLAPKGPPGLVVIRLDAGVAFGSGEHGSTCGCLRAFEQVIRAGRPRHILDLGTGSGILAITAAKLLHRSVLATDIEPWAVRVTRQNARLNGVGPLVRAALAPGWQGRPVRDGAPYDLVFANILARPLCAMAGSLSQHLAPGGRAILSGLLASQARLVLAAHRRQGLVLDGLVREGRWTTLVVRKFSPYAGARVGAGSMPARLGC